MAKAAFQTIERDRTAIESAFGGELAWEPLPDARASRICVYIASAMGADHVSPAVQYEWFIVTAPRFVDALRAIVDRMSARTLTSVEQATAEG